MNIQALVVNPNQNGRAIRQRLQQLGVKCDALFCINENSEQLDYLDQDNYRYLYHTLADVLNNPHQLCYQLVISGSPSGEQYCQTIVEQLGLNGVAITQDGQSQSKNDYHHIVSFR